MFLLDANGNLEQSGSKLGSKELAKLHSVLHTSSRTYSHVSLAAKYLVDKVQSQNGKKYRHTNGRAASWHCLLYFVKVVMDSIVDSNSLWLIFESTNTLLLLVAELEHCCHDERMLLQAPLYSVSH